MHWILSSFFYLIFLTVPAFAQNSFDEVLKELDQVPVPIIIKSHGVSVYGKEILYELWGDELIKKYQDQLILNKYIKAILVKANSLEFQTGQKDDYHFYGPEEVKERDQHKFDINFKDPRIHVSKEEGGFVLRAKLYVREPEDLELKENFMHTLTQIKSAIEAQWQFHSEDLNFRAEVDVAPHPKTCLKTISFDDLWDVAYPDHFDITLGSVGRSHVHDELFGNDLLQNQEVFLYLHREGPALDEMFAHEFGHLIGFGDLYCELISLDLEGNFLPYISIAGTDGNSIPITTPWADFDPFMGVIRTGHSLKWMNVMEDGPEAAMLREQVEAILKNYVSTLMENVGATGQR